MVSKSLEKEKDDYDARSLRQKESASEELSIIEKFRGSKILVTTVFGFLVATAYIGDLIPPIIWGESLLYFPGLVAGFFSSLAYKGDYSPEKIGSITGLISSLPLLIAITEIHMYYGINADIFISVIASMSTAVILGLIGHYLASVIQN